MTALVQQTQWKTDRQIDRQADRYTNGKIDRCKMRLT